MSELPPEVPLLVYRITFAFILTVGFAILAMPIVAGAVFWWRSRRR